MGDCTNPSQSLIYAWAVPGSVERAAEPGSGRLGTGRQLQQHIVTIFALYARGDVDTIAVADLIRLLAAMGVDGPAARSALSRLKKRGVLLSTKDAGAAAYRLDPGLEDVFREGDERIFSPRRAQRGDRWLLAAFSVPEARRELRHQLRKILGRRGFGTVGSGLWIAPEFVYTELHRELARAGLLDFVEFFAADHLGEVEENVGAWWDLDALTELYSRFRDTFEPVRIRSTDSDDESAFADHVRLVTAWRRLPYLDPGLPLEYLPEDWQGLAAGRLFAALNEQLAAAAARHVATVRGTRGARRG